MAMAAAHSDTLEAKTRQAVIDQSVSLSPAEPEPEPRIELTTDFTDFTDKEWNEHPTSNIQNPEKHQIPSSISHEWELDLGYSLDVGCSLVCLIPEIRGQKSSPDAATAKMPHAPASSLRRARNPGSVPRKSARRCWARTSPYTRASRIIISNRCFKASLTIWPSFTSTSSINDTP